MSTEGGAQLDRPTWQEQAPVFSAIGNTGDLAFLPDIERASRHPDPDARAVVPSALRRMPFAQVRDFELAWLRRETSPDVMRELFNLIHHQHEELGTVVDSEFAAEAVAYLRRQPRVLTRQSILLMLQPLVGSDERVRLAFRDQLPVEYQANTGLFSFVASSLPEADVEFALAKIPSLADQLRGGSTGPAAPLEPIPTPGEMPRLGVP